MPSVDSSRKPTSIDTAVVPGQRSSIGGSPSSQFHSLSSMNWVDQPAGPAATGLPTADRTRWLCSL